MKVLFIGGTGTISTACAALSVEKGVDLWLLTRGTRSERLHPGAHALSGDIRDEETAALLKGREWDCVVDWTAREPADARRDVKLFRKRAKRFVFVSSTAVYTKPLKSPRVDEEAAVGNPLWGYANRKAACEDVFLREHKEKGFPVVIVRPGHTYAEFACPSGFIGMGFRVMDRIERGKPVVTHGSGRGRWPLTWSGDFARYFVPLMSADNAEGEAFHIASNEALSWRQIYNTMGEALGKTVDLIHVPAKEIARYDEELGASLLGDKAHSCVYDNSKVRRWVPDEGPFTPFRKGIRRCVEWRENHPGPHGDPRKDELMDLIARRARETGAAPAKETAE